MKKANTAADLQRFSSEDAHHPNTTTSQTSNHGRRSLSQVVKTLRRTQSHARDLGHGLGSSTTLSSSSSSSAALHHHHNSQASSSKTSHFGRLGSVLLRRWHSHREEVRLERSGAEEEEEVEKEEEDEEVEDEEDRQQQLRQRRLYQQIRRSRSFCHQQGHHYHHLHQQFLRLQHHGADHGSLFGHSLASVELASWTAARGANRRGSSFHLPFTSTFSSSSSSVSSSSFSPTGDPARNVASLECVQAAIVKLFQRKPLREHELGTLQNTIRTLSEAEAGSLILEYYKDQLLKKGMVILREKIKNEQGAELLAMLGETWDYFFTQILPSLQALMYPMAEVLKDIDIRNTTLLEFRNIVVLKVGLKDAVESKKYQVPASIRQMLLVLQGLKDPTFLSKEQLDVEKLTACCVEPFLGTRGLYLGSPDPVTKALYRPPSILTPTPIHGTHLRVPGTPDITISGTDDLRRGGGGFMMHYGGGSPPHHHPHHHNPHHHPHHPVTSTHHLHRMEQQHNPIASPAAMRKRHPPFSPPPITIVTPTTTSPTSFLGAGGGLGGPSASMSHRLKPVLEVVGDVTMGRRHSVLGT